MTLTFVVTLFAQSRPTLSGTVFAGNSPLANSMVEALEHGTSQTVAKTTTETTGRYRLTLSKGVFDLRITPAAGTSLRPALIQNVTIQEANLTQDFVLLSPGGLITGTVRGLGGKPLQNVTVGVSSRTEQGLAQTRTDSQGNYTIAASGVVRLHVSGSESPFAPASWSVERRDLNVAGTVRADIDLPVITINGTVRRDGGESVQGASGSFYTYRDDSDTKTQSQSSGYFNCDSAGNYSLLLLAGSADAMVFPPPGAVVAPLWQSGLSANDNSSRDFVLTSAASMSGIVRGLDGHALSNVNVAVFGNRPNQYLGQVRTDSNGRYRIPASGLVSLRFSGSSSPYSPAAWNLYRSNVDASTSPVINIDLPVVRVKGVIKADGGGRISNAAITIATSFSDTLAPIKLDSSTTSNSDGDGEYSALVLSGIAEFKIHPPSGTPLIPVAQVKINLASDVEHDIVLPSAKMISGTVRGFAGTPLERVYVYAYAAGTDLNLAQAITDANGHYSIPASGSVYLRFTPTLTSTPPRNAPATWTFTRSDVQASNPTMIDIDIPVIKVSGTITDAKGIGVANVSVSTSTGQPGRNSQMESTSASYVSSDSAGRYSFLVFAGNREQSIGPLEGGYPRVVVNWTDNNRSNDEILQRIVLQSAP